MILTAFAWKRIAQADVSLAMYACMSLNDLTSGGAWNFQAYACHLNYFNSSHRSAISWDGHWQLHNIHSTDMPALGRQQIHAVRTESELTKASCHLFTNPQKRQTPIRWHNWHSFGKNAMSCRRLRCACTLRRSVSTVTIDTVCEGPSFLSGSHCTSSTFPSRSSEELRPGLSQATWAQLCRTQCALPIQAIQI